MSAEDPGRAMPELVRALHDIPVDYADGEGIDFEPFSQFMSRDKTTQWFRAWTGNDTVQGDDFLIFGQDGSGGYAAFWRAGESVPILDGPIVFLGSEGELGVVAREFGDYLWLLAAGVGPYEAISANDREGSANPDFAVFAVGHSTTVSRSPREIRVAAQTAFPSFEEQVLALIR